MTPENIALKRAFAETVKGVGGLEAAAGFCRVGKSVLGDNQSINKPDCFPALDVIADLEPLARDREGWPHVTSALCRVMGGTFVALPEVTPGRGDVMRLLGQLSTEMSEATAAICEALADGKIEDHEIPKCVRELDDTIRVAATMRALLTSLGGK